jgi:hypothetical protein
MSANQYICTVPIFQGNQGKYYILDGYKYDIHFPLAWALDHHNHKPYYSEKKNKTYINGSGPKKCSDCSLFGSIYYVFIGYCSNCLRDVYHDKRGDHSVAPGMSVGMLSECTLWKQYPYLNGVKFEEIGDKIAQEEDDKEEELDEDEEYNKYKEDFEKDFERIDLEDEEERYREERYGNQLEKFKDMCCRD